METITPSSECLNPLYKALEEGQIRLLTTDPGEDDSPIVTHLQVTNILKSGFLWSWLESFWPRFHYEALSYHWGAVDTPVSIICEGQPMMIHKNLYDALSSLRHLRPGIPLWVDSICIDQNNLDEKRAQIQMMGRIYSTASRVWAFIGKAPDESQLLEFQQLLPRIIQACQKTQRHARRYAESTVFARGSSTDTLPGVKSILNEINSELSRIAPESSSVWKTLASIITREYFNRLWILQEVALAKEVKFLCGSYIIKWSHMKLLLEGVWPAYVFPDLAYNGLRVNKACLQVSEVLGDSTTWSGWFSTIVVRFLLRTGSYLVKHYRHKTDGNDPMYGIAADLLSALQSDALGQMLGFSRSQTCSEPIDRIFGLTGIIEILVGGNDLPWLRGVQSTEKVYIETFHYLAQGKSPLRSLCLAPPGSSCGLSLPSWCPDFHRPRRSLIAADGFSDMEQRYYGRSWQSSITRQSVVQESDPTVLALQGVRVSKIARVFPDWRRLSLNGFWQSPDVVDKNVKYVATWIHETMGYLLSIHNQKECDIQESFWHTIALQDNALNSIDNEASLADFEALGTLLRPISSSESTYLEERTRWFASHPHLSKPTTYSPLHLLDKIDNNMDGKVLFLTEDNRIGLGFPGIQDGDLLVVLRGATVPHILRQSQRHRETWTFHGESYMRGIMHGEAELTNGDGVRPISETFILV